MLVLMYSSIDSHVNREQWAVRKHKRGKCGSHMMQHHYVDFKLELSARKNKVKDAFDLSNLCNAAVL